MIRRIITFSVALMLSFSQIWVAGPGISIWFGTVDIVHRDLILQSAYAETKQISPKSSQKSISNKKESLKPELRSQKPDGITFEGKNFPDGVIGRRYSFVLVPANTIPPFNVTLVSGTLPPGLKLNQRTGGIEGEPNQAGVYNLTLRVAD
ncbi:MAG: putative Ig domain-containing protein, partial [Candidatus Aenigmarchaeota archaeon]|nr:putative Ig domain-containing protein [Candidatus Aenigmarchaeota archaeon]